MWATPTSINVADSTMPNTMIDMVFNPSLIHITTFEGRWFSVQELKLAFDTGAVFFDLISKIG